MIKSEQNSIWLMTGTIALVLTASGCATKKYVRQQIAPVNNKVAQLEVKTNDQVTYLNNKIDRNTSQLNERIDTTDQKVGQLSAAYTQVQGTASRALQQADENKVRTAANTTAINTLTANVSNALNYQLVEKGDVTFAFNKAALTEDDKAGLDQIVMRFKALPRGVVELTGYTDRTGSRTYNYALSRRRAETVQRYLVMRGIPLRSIHI